MNSKLSPTQRREAQEMYKSGLSSREVAQEMGVCQVAVLDLVNGRTYGGKYRCEVRARGVTRGSKRGRYKDGGLVDVEKLLEETLQLYGGA